MKILLILLMFSIGMIAGNYEKELVAYGKQDFYLKIKLIDYEKSKDSNSQHYSVIVKNNDVSYHYRYYGFPFPTDREKSNRYRLSKGQFDEMIEQIKSDNIDRNVTELRKEKYLGHSVDLSLTLKLNGKTIQSRITGMTSSFRDQDALIDHQSYVDHIESLITYLRARKLHKQ